MCVTPRFGTFLGGGPPPSRHGGPAGIGRKRQETIYTAGFAGCSLPVPVSPDRLEAAAIRKLGRDAAYFAGGAGPERTAANQAAFDKCRIVQRAMRNVATRDLTLELFGRPYVYGLALAGGRGVGDVIANLAAELDLTLGLSGRRSLRELDRSAVAFTGGHTLLEPRPP